LKVISLSLTIVFFNSTGGFAVLVTITR
jgi:hypothetical protein